VTRLRRTLLLLTLGLPLAARLPAQGKTTDPAQKYVLDFDVPESPALVGLGTAMGNVTRGSAAKPFVAQLVNQFQAGEKVANGLALDFAPYFLYGGGRLASIEEYRRNAIKRILANAAVSVATAQAPSDTSSLLFGIGARITLFDRHDLLADRQLGADIDAALAAQASSEGADTLSDDVVGPATGEVDLTQAYANATKRVRNKKGGALTVAWAMRGTLRGSIASGDSVQDVRHTVWLAYRYSFPGGTDLLTTAQWRQDETDKSSIKGGIALRTNTRRYNVAAELFYDSNPDEVASGRFGVGVNGEVSLFSGVALIGSLATEPVAVGNRTESRLRLRTSLRWNASAEP
jgi:hypothetical protein